MQDALRHLKQNGVQVLDDDIVMLSPLRYEHVNVLGHYSFTLADTILAGQHRPLNQLGKAFGENLESLLVTIDNKSDVSWGL